MAPAILGSTCIIVVVTVLLSVISASMATERSDHVGVSPRRRWLTDGKRLVTLTATRMDASPRCTSITDRPLARSLLQRLGAGELERLSRPQMDEMLRVCDELESNRQVKQRSKRSLFIFPGTLWCGHGDNAHNSSQLGEKKAADACCRDHDHCPVKIYRFSSRYGLVNTAPYTRLSCECEEQFYQCLKQAQDITATAVGNLYFNVFSGSCLQPTNTVSCSSSSWWSWLTSRCDSTEQVMGWGEFTKDF